MKSEPSSSEYRQSLLNKAEAGDIHAQVQVAHYTMQGWFFEKDEAVAERWYRRAAERGDAVAQSNLGALLLAKLADNTSREARCWFEKAAIQGNPIAQFNLAVMLFHGKGGETDKARAAVWFRKAAEQGDAAAQRNLGIQYRHGEGIAKDREESLLWLLASASQGDFQAMDQLGNAYTEQDCSEDEFIDGLAWIQLRTTLGRDVDGHDTAMEIRTALENRATPRMIKASRKRCLELLAMVQRRRK